MIAGIKPFSSYFKMPRPLLTDRLLNSRIPKRMCAGGFGLAAPSTLVILVQQI